MIAAAGNVRNGLPIQVVVSRISAFAHRASKGGRSASGQFLTSVAVAIGRFWCYRAVK